MQDDVLFTKLYRLTKKVAAILVDRSSNGGIPKIRLPYPKKRFGSFEYTEGNIGYSFTTEQGFKEIWDSSEIQRHLAPLKTETDYLMARKDIEDLKHVQSVQADYWLITFLEKVSTKILEGQNDDKILGLTLSFVNELEGNPVIHRTTVWLRGVWIKDDMISLDNGIVFRKPKQTDFEEDDGDFFNHGFIVYPSLVMDYSLKSKDFNDVQKYTLKLVLLLRLFGVGSVESIRSKQRNESMLSFYGTQFGNIERFENYKYPIGSSNSDTLQDFISKIGELLPPFLIDGTGTVDHFVIAIQRYADALLKSQIPEGRISFGVMALEALYLGADERQELKDRLSQRAAKVLSNFGFKPLVVYEEIRRAYDIRSNFVHGSPINNEHGDLTGLASQILEYVRASIVISLQMKVKYDKEKFLGNIDKSLLDSSISEGLMASIKAACSLH